MDKIKMLDRLKKHYDNGGNIISYLKSIGNSKENCIEDIMISYDFQAGTYTDICLGNTEKYNEYYRSISEIFDGLNLNKEWTILEAGVGEATTLGSVLNMVNTDYLSKAYGFDISWSRIKYAKKFLDNKCKFEQCELFVADLFMIPIKDNGIDLVYTSHSIEPNGGKEKEILEELYRITNKYLVLFEPSYELAGKEARERMEKNGYVTKLYDTAIELGYKVIKHELLKTILTPLNPTGVMVIEKGEEHIVEEAICCPISKGDLIKSQDAMFCEESLLAYPIIGGIPCLTQQNAIVATKFLS